MSVTVEHYSSPLPAMFGAAMYSTGHNLVKTESATTRLKATFSRSREGSPSNDKKLPKVPSANDVKHCSPRSSPKMSPSMTIRVTRCVTTATTSSCTKEPFKCPPPRQCAAPTVCDKLKQLNICADTRATTSQELSDRIQDPNNGILLLDCRPFIAFNMIHIQGSLSLNCCDRLTRKRLQCGKIHLEDIVSGQSGKKEYREKIENMSSVIIYDEETLDVESAGPPTPLKLVINTLKKQGADVAFLRGGLSSFKNDFGELCIRPDYQPPPKLLYSPTTPEVVDADIDTAVVSEILPHLFIGNCRDASSRNCLKEHGISHVLNVTSHLPLHFEDEGMIYKRLAASDSGHQNLKQYFDDAFNFIEDAKRSGGKVLIHCQAGVSRSATIAISYIMRKTKLGMLEAFHFVKAKRSIVAPNFNFMGQLYELEKQISEGQVQRQTSTPIPVELLLQ